jgi:hypothetical protein
MLDNNIPPTFSVNANAEDLRSTFVVHEGKKDIEIVVEATRYTFDFGWMAEEFGNKLKENVSLMHLINIYLFYLSIRLSIQAYMSGYYPTTQLLRRTIR